MVGLAASVSVWSIGAPLSGSYKNADSKDGGTDAESDAVKQDGGDSADKYAGDQSSSGSSGIAGQLGGYSGDTNQNTADSRVSKNLGDTGTTINANSVNATGLGNKVSAPVNPDRGTSAKIASGTTIDAGDDILVTAHEHMDVDMVVGTVAAGAVGVGAGITVVNLSSQVQASAGGSLTAGDLIKVEAEFDQEVDITAVALQAGFVGLGASVVVVTDTSAQDARLLNGTIVNDANSLQILATNRQDFAIFTLGVQVGTVAAGASFTRLDVDGSTVAHIGSNSQIGLSSSVGSITVTASLTIDAVANTIAIVGGTGAFSFNFAFIDITLDVEASMGTNVDIIATGALNLTATTSMDAQGDVFAVSVGAAAAGTSLTDVNVSPDLDVHIGGGGTNIHAGSITLLASHNHGTNRGARAIAEAAGDGIVSGQGAIPTANANATLDSYVASGATLDTGSGAIVVKARGRNLAVATANAFSAGLAAVGASISKATAGGSILAHMDGNVDDAGSLAVMAEADNDATATAEAAGGGLIAATIPLAEAIASPTVRAYIGGTATIVMVGAVTITADSKTKATGAAVSAGGGLVGVGVSQSKATTSPTIEAAVRSGASIQASSLTLRAKHNVGGSDGAVATAEAAGGGGLSFQFTKATATSAAAVTSGVTGATLNVSGTILVEADLQNRATATGDGFNVGALAIGTVTTIATTGGSTSAFINGGTVNAAILVVDADSEDTAIASSTATGGGLISGSENDARATVAPTVTAYATGILNVPTITIVATAQPKAKATSTGTAVLGGLTIGVSKAIATADATVNAWAGGTITADSLSVTALHILASHSAEADAVGSAGGLLLGFDATVTKAVNGAEVNAYIADSSSLNILGVVNIVASSETSQHADSSSDSIGLIAVGVTNADAKATTITKAYLGTSVDVVASSLSVVSFGVDTNYSQAKAGAGGLGAGASSTANTKNTATVTAEIGASSTVELTTRGSGALIVGGQHEARFNSRVIASAVGFVSGASADALHDIASTVTARIGSSAVITARNIQMDAVNLVDKAALAGGASNMKGSAKALFGGGGANSLMTLALTSLVDIGTFAQMTVVGLPTNDDVFNMRAFNQTIAFEKITFSAAGLGAGAGANATVCTTTDLAKVNIGSNAILKSSGRIDASARGAGTVIVKMSAEANGGVGVVVGVSKIDLKPLNQIVVGTSAQLLAEGDVRLGAGRDGNFSRDFYTLETRFDPYSSAAIPVDDIDARTFILQRNEITVSVGALMQSAREASLHAERLGINSIQANAVGHSWAANLFNAGSEFEDGNSLSEAHAVVRNDGTVETGTQRVQSLTLNNWNRSDGLITAYDMVGNVSFFETKELLESDLVRELRFAEEEKAKYPGSPTLVAFYQSEIDRITAELLTLGLLETADSGPNAGATVGSEQFVMTVWINPIHAEAGMIDVRTDQTTGSGVWIAPGDALITIENNTPAFINILGMTIPEVNGGLFINGIEIKGADLAARNAAIVDINVFSANFDNDVNQGGVDPIVVPETATFGLIPDSSTDTPEIRIEQKLRADTVGGTFREIIDVTFSGQNSPTDWTPSTGYQLVNAIAVTGVGTGLRVNITVGTDGIPG